MSMTSASKPGYVVKSANSLAVIVEKTGIVVIGWAMETGELVERTGRGLGKKKEGDNLCI